MESELLWNVSLKYLCYSCYFYTVQLVHLSWETIRIQLFSWLLGPKLSRLYFSKQTVLLHSASSSWGKIQMWIEMLISECFGVLLKLPLLTTQCFPVQEKIRWEYHCLPKLYIQGLEQHPPCIPRTKNIFWIWSKIVARPVFPLSFYKSSGKTV